MGSCVDSGEREEKVPTMLSACSWPTAALIRRKEFADRQLLMKLFWQSLGSPRGRNVTALLLLLAGSQVLRYRR